MSGPEKVPSAEGHMSAEGTFSGPQVQRSGAPPLTKSEKIKPGKSFPGPRPRKSTTRCKIFGGLLGVVPRNFALEVPKKCLGQTYDLPPKTLFRDLTSFCFFY